MYVKTVTKKTFDKKQIKYQNYTKFAINLHLILIMKTNIKKILSLMRK